MNAAILMLFTYLPCKYFIVCKMITNNKKAFIEDFV